MPTKTKAKSATEKEVVYAAAARHGVPGWLLWGVYGAENGWNPNNGVQFGLIEPNYPQLNGGRGRIVKNPHNIAESADIAAELFAKLKQEHGSWAGAVLAYSGGEYSISHPQQLSTQNPSQGQMVPVNFIEEGLEGLGTIFGLNNPMSQAHSGSGETGLEAGGRAGEAAGGLLSPIVGPLTTIAEVFKGVGELLFTPEGWVRLAKMIGGAIFFLWGLEILVQGSKVAGKTTSGIGKAVEVAALVK